MSLLNVMCKEIGVEVEKEWLGNDGDKYKITKNGELQYWYDEEEIWNTLLNEWYRRLLTGELKPVWKPKYGEVYYVPDFSDLSLCTSRYWNDTPTGNGIASKGLAFKTRQEAIECANKMLEVVK